MVSFRYFVLVFQIKGKLCFINDIKPVLFQNKCFIYHVSRNLKRNNKILMHVILCFVSMNTSL